MYSVSVLDQRKSVVFDEALEEGDVSHELISFQKYNIHFTNSIKEIRPSPSRSKLANISCINSDYTGMSFTK